MKPLSFKFTMLLLKAKALFLGCLFASQLFSQPVIAWQKTLGGTDDDEANSIQETLDAGYIVAGATKSHNGNVFGNHGFSDCWVVKLSNSGAIQWQRPLGGSWYDVASSIQQTSDGGYIVGGGTTSSDGDVTGNHGNFDCWVIKLDNFGFIEWQKTIGGSNGEAVTSIKQTSDGGYVLSAGTWSFDGDVSGYHGDNDGWIVKLDATGNIQWQKTLGGSAYDGMGSIQQTTDNGFIVAGETTSIDGDVSGNHGKQDAWIVKLDVNGIIEWQKTIGGSDGDSVNSILQTNDSGYVVAGCTSSKDGDISSNHGVADFWVVKLSEIGVIQWQRTLGGSAGECATSIDQTEDGGYIITGTTVSQDGDISGYYYYNDIWIVKLSSTGLLQWQKTVGGFSFDNSSTIQQSSDQGFILAGSTSSNDGDVSGNYGLSDFWIVKLSPFSVNTQTLPGQNFNLQVFPNPAQQSITLKTLFAEPDIKVIIINLSGEEITRQTITNGEPINISNFANGMYLLTAITSSGKICAGKFCKFD